MKHSMKITLTLASFALVLYLGLMAFAPKQTQGYKIGDKAADFSLKNIDGKTMSLQDLGKVKGYVVVFTCNHCPYAKLYEDRIIALDKKYKAKGFPVIAINPNDAEAYPEDSYDNMKVRAQEKGFTFPYLHDESQKIAQAFGAAKTPHVFLLDADRVVRYMGGIDDSPRDPEAVSKTYLADAIDALAKGKKIKTNSTKAVGCSIKWKK